MRVLIDYRPALPERTGASEWVHPLVSGDAGFVADLADTPSLADTILWILTDELPARRRAGRECGRWAQFGRREAASFLRTAYQRAAA